MSDVISSVHVKSLFVDSEANRQRIVLDKYQMRGVEWVSERVLDLLGLHAIPQETMSLPQTKVSYVQIVECAIFHHRRARYK